MPLPQVKAVPNVSSHFKPMPLLATSSPDSPTKNSNGDTPNAISGLSPFARKLYEQTNVAFTGRPPCRLEHAATNQDSTECQATRTTSKRTRSFPKHCCSFSSSTTGSPSSPTATSHHPQRPCPRTQRGLAISLECSILRSQQHTRTPPWPGSHDKAKGSRTRGLQVH